MRRSSRCLGLALAVALCLAPVAAGQGGDVRPVHRVNGLTGPELLAESWATLLEIPASENPLLGAGDQCISLGRHDAVLAPVLPPDVTTTCSIRPGTPVMLIPFGTECSDVEPPPFFAEGEAAQQACATELDQVIEDVLITVDGGPAISIRDPRFELVSPQGTADLPPDNIFGVEAQTATFSAHAWAALVRGLTPGEHVITAEVVGEPFSGTATLVLQVGTARR